ncbi:MAG: glutamate formimidoyltransferase [Bacilli bacterium]|nr:glutamate formimidoyltransferase [Bacilli bacterium]
MKKIIEIVPNYSEGINNNIMAEIISPFENEKDIFLVKLEMDASYNRSVLTVIGEATIVLEKMVESAKIATKLIDLTKHSGEHPRMGAVDVIPILPIQNITEEECIELSKDLGKRINEATNVPIFLYSKSATRPHTENLPDIREGEFEGLKEKMQDPRWHSDFGNNYPHETAGVFAVGCRKPLIAFNIDVNSKNKNQVAGIARRVRYSGGGYRYIQANAAHLHDKDIYQVTMNLTDYEKTALYQAIEAVKMEAKRFNTEIISTEIVGLVSVKCLENSLKYYLRMPDTKKLDYSLEEIVEMSIKHFKLRDFSVDKVIEYYIK